MSDININSGNYSNNQNTIIGNHNVVNQESSISDVSWKTMKEELRRIIKEIPDENKELLLLEDMYDYIRKKDEKGMKGFLKRNKEAFLTGTIVNMLYSSSLWDFVNIFLK